MSCGHENAPCGLPAVTGRADIKSVAECTFVVTPNDGSESISICISGRLQWTLKRLSKAGQEGCTPIDYPAPRWSGYVHQLRKFGLPIVTITEKHGGEFPGTHARYVLQAVVQEIDSNG